MGSGHMKTDSYRFALLSALLPLAVGGCAIQGGATRGAATPAASAPPLAATAQQTASAAPQTSVASHQQSSIANRASRGPERARDAIRHSDHADRPDRFRWPGGRPVQGSRRQQGEEAARQPGQHAGPDCRKQPASRHRRTTRCKAPSSATVSSISSCTRMSAARSSMAGRLRWPWATCASGPLPCSEGGLLAGSQGPAIAILASEGTSGSGGALVGRNDGTGRQVGGCLE